MGTKSVAHAVEWLNVRRDRVILFSSDSWCCSSNRR